MCGGQGKGADFSELTNEIDKKCEAVIIYGEDKKQIGSKVKICSKYYVNNLKEAILKALNLSKPKFTILFSPACASFDMFNNFEERGEEFKRLILNEGNT
jgi:UDP-N-acetylmuramoylalanine--D-glutamate ligase